MSRGETFLLAGRSTFWPVEASAAKTSDLGHSVAAVLCERGAILVHLQRSTGLLPDDAGTLQVLRDRLLVRKQIRTPSRGDGRYSRSFPFADVTPERTARPLN